MNDVNNVVDDDGFDKEVVINTRQKINNDNSFSSYLRDFGGKNAANVKRRARGENVVGPQTLGGIWSELERSIREDWAAENGNDSRPVGVGDERGGAEVLRFANKMFYAGAMGLMKLFFLEGVNMEDVLAELGIWNNEKFDVDC